ncbi:MAG TPA: TetR/AcrR family transcriptional regulator [Galbitalea sp.]|jgi:AcrR family transcriptional regulator|nr:TetR/AcrR family transcriptional regulator [Galbitalea sp.]
MPRHSDPSRKPQLLAEIIEHLLDKSLASVSFRTIAQALGCSTYTLVYHFGSREELLSEIVSAVSTRTTAIDEQMRSASDTLEEYFASFDASWEWTLQPRNRQLQRLEFEASLIESLQPKTHTFSRALFSTWQRIGEDALVRLGVERTTAQVEARILIDTFYGIQYDFVLNNEATAATRAYREVMTRHRERIESLLPVA